MVDLNECDIVQMAKKWLVLVPNKNMFCKCHNSIEVFHLQPRKLIMVKPTNSGMFVVVIWYRRSVCNQMFTMVSAYHSLLTEIKQISKKYQKIGLTSHNPFLQVTHGNPLHRHVSNWGGSCIGFVGQQRSPQCFACGEFIARTSRETIYSHLKHSKNHHKPS